MFKLIRYIYKLIKLSNQKFYDKRALSQRQKLIQEAMNQQSSALHTLRVASKTAIQYIRDSEGKLEAAELYIDHSLANKLSEVETALGCKFELTQSVDGIDVYFLRIVEQEL